jgi:WD40 repeat protein
VTTVDTVRDPASLTSPFVGLTSYAQENAPFFFGRDAEQRVLISNLRASRLTLLYAQSGAGKSSVLRAGAAAKLAELARRSVEQRGLARHIPVVFSSWRDEPTGELIAEIDKAIAPFLPKPSPPGHTLERLDEVIEAASNAAGATLLVMLDQFEEYFLYRPRETHDGRFADELAACINRAGLHANFLISIREDAYSGLGDLFQGRIRNVYSNYLHLEHLTRESAREAIEKPITSFNELHPTEVPVEIEPGLADVILGQLGPDQFAPDQGGIGRLPGGNGSDLRGGEIAASYLQLVMKRLWETELTTGSRTLHRATLEELGGAQTIVRTHVDRALDDLPEEAREAAVDIFHHLVTPSGTKIALAASDLAEYTGRPAAESTTLLERLASSDTRILRPVPPPPGQEGGTRYEISHDLLAPAILDWGGRQRAVRLQREKESAERVARVEKRRARMFRTLALGSGALLIIAIVALVVAVIAGHTAQRASQNAVHQRDIAVSDQLAVQAEAQLDSQPELSILLSVEAFRTKDTAEARSSLLHEVVYHRGVRSFLSGHTGPVTSVAFSPDGRTIASASDDGTVKLWNPDHKTSLKTLTVGGQVHDVAFSGDGHTLASASFGKNKTIILWEAGRYTRLRALAGGDTRSIAFSPDGRTLASASADGAIMLWNFRTGTRLSRVTGVGDVYDVAFSPDGHTLASAGADGAVKLWNLDRGNRAKARTLRGQAGPVMSVAFSPDGHTLASASADGAIMLWNFRTGTRLSRVTGVGDVYDVAFSLDGHTLASAGADGTVRLWDPRDGAGLSPPLTSHTNTVNSVAFSRDGHTFASGGDDDTIIVWDLARLGILRGHTNTVNSVAFSPDGHTLASGGSNGTVMLWNPDRHIRVGVLRREGATSSGHDVTSVAFGPGGHLLASGAIDGTVTLWNVDRQIQVGTLTNPVARGLARLVMSVAFSPKGRMLAAGLLDGTITLWDVERQVPLGTLRSPVKSISNIVFSPDGRTLASVSDSGTVVLWDISRRVAVRTLPGAAKEGTGIAFSPDGTTLAFGDENTILLWDIRHNARLGALTGQTTAVTSVAFSPDGHTLASGSNGGAVMLWDVDRRTQIGVLTGHTRPVESVAFSPDGHTLASAGDDKTVMLWQISPSQWIQQLCRIVARDLSRAEWDEFLPGQPHRHACG